MASPTQELDIAAPLAPKMGVGPMVRGQGRRPTTEQHETAPATGATDDRSS